jgi:hypothetical protein
MDRTHTFLGRLPSKYCNEVAIQNAPNATDGRLSTLSVMNYIPFDRQQHPIIYHFFRNYKLTMEPKADAVEIATVFTTLQQ